MKKKKLNIRLLALLLLVIGIVLVAIGFWLFAPKSQLIDDTFEITGNQSFSLKSRDKLNDEDGLKQFNTIRIKNVFSLRFTCLRQYVLSPTTSAAYLVFSVNTKMITISEK